MSGCERTADALIQLVTRSDSTSAIHFPRVRRGLVAEVASAANPHAPACAEAPPDTARWVATIVSTESDAIPWITLRVPFGYVERLPRDYAQRPGDPRPPRPLGSWERHATTAPADTGHDITVWLGEGTVYPPVAMPFHSKQLELEECQTAVESDTLRIASFVVRTPDGATRHLLTAYRSIGGDSVISAVARASDAHQLEELSLILRTVRLFRR